MGDEVAAAARVSTPAAGHSLLDFPHYTRPPSFRGWDVPEVLLGGNHEEIRRWRRQKAIEKTLRNRPDLLNGEPAANG
jgi:tRNA (guanine37-N1)-methyltransferase